MSTKTIDNQSKMSTIFDHFTLMNQNIPVKKFIKANTSNFVRCSGKYVITQA